jgi:hypothetical protein
MSPDGIEIDQVRLDHFGRLRYHKSDWVWQLFSSTPDEFVDSDAVRSSSCAFYNQQSPRDKLTGRTGSL